MPSATATQPFWTLITIHLFLVVQIIYIRVFKPSKSARVANFDGRVTGKNSAIYNSTVTVYTRFPKNSWRTFFKCIKVLKK